MNARLQNTLRRAAKFAGANARTRARTRALSHALTHTKHTNTHLYLYHLANTARGELQKKNAFLLSGKKCTKNAQHFFAVVHARARCDILIRISHSHFIYPIILDFSF